MRSPPVLGRETAVVEPTVALTFRPDVAKPNTCLRTRVPGVNNAAHQNIPFSCSRHH